MELRQLRYFVRVCELGGFGRAAADLGVVTSALSQQVSRLEGELATRLLLRTSAGVVPTDAGLAFLRQAQLVLRHVDAAAQAAQSEQLPACSRSETTLKPFLTITVAPQPGQQARLHCAPHVQHAVADRDADARDTVAAGASHEDAQRQVLDREVGCGVIGRLDPALARRVVGVVDRGLPGHRYACSACRSATGSSNEHDPKLRARRRAAA